MYKFRSKADADLIMMKPVGDQLLGLIGKEPAASGIIEAAALPAAIDALEGAIAAERAARRPAGGSADGAEDGRPGGAPIGLHRRAWPLLEMMKRAAADRADVVWGV